MLRMPDNKYVTLFILFVLISNPVTYNITNSVTSMIGMPIASPGGCPNMFGILLHGAVLVYLCMYFAK